MQMQMYMGRIGVHYLLEIRGFFGYLGKRGFPVVLPVVLLGIFQISPKGRIGRGEDTPCKVAAQRKEQEIRTGVLKRVEMLVDLPQMLMGERFVPGYIVVSPTEMRGFREAGTRTCASGQGMDMHFV